MKITVGGKAPDFSLPSGDGKTVRLSDFLGKTVVLYFYPKDETPGCTAESCDFRDSYTVFKDAGAEVIGVSADSPESHRSFAANHRLPFLLLSDEKNEVRKLFGVPKTLGLIPGRVTYVIDQAGVVKKIFSSQFNPKAHVEEALAEIRLLDSRPAAAS